jgi:prophage tail gpP-like protein
MSTPDVTLQVNGSSYAGWQTIGITLGIEQIAGTFDLTTTERWPNQPSAWRINPGDACTLSIGSTQVISGYVDDFDPSYDKSSHTIKITGRDKTGDLVDSAAVHKAGEWRNASLTRIAKDLCTPFGINVIAQVDVGKPFACFAIWHSETAFECLDRAARMRGVLLLSDGNGNLILGRTGTQRIATPLIKGQNIEAATGHFSWKNRFSQYIVKGQTAMGAGTWDHPAADSSALANEPKHYFQTKASVNDTAITRYRPHVTIAYQGDGSTYQDRATWERNIRIGKGNRVTYTVTGWEHSTGLWLPNQLVQIQDDFMGYDGDLLISQVRFTLTEETGTQAAMDLCLPSAFELINLPDKHRRRGKAEVPRWN